MKAFGTWLHEQSSEELRPENITPIDVAEYRSYLLTKGRKPASINRVLISICTFCNWGINTNQIAANPVREIMTVKQQQLSPKALDRKEQLALMRAVQRDGSLRDVTIITLMLHSGIRVSELVDIELDDIALSDRSGWLIVREGNGKKQRKIPLNSTVSQVLKKYLNEKPDAYDRHLFLSQKSGLLTTRAVQYVVEKYAYNAKLEGVSPHSLRHTAAKNLIDQGISLDKVAMILGHSNLNVTARYTIPTERDLESALEKVTWEKKSYQYR